MGLVRALAPQLAEQHITVNAICPSLVDTNMLDETMRGELKGSGFPLIEPETVAEAVLQCLLGEETGQAMVIQAGRDPLAYRFARPPGPRAEGQKEAAACGTRCSRPEVGRSRVEAPARPAWRAEDAPPAKPGAPLCVEGDWDALRRGRSRRYGRPTPQKSSPVRTGVSQTTAPV